MPDATITPDAVGQIKGIDGGGSTSRAQVAAVRGVTVTIGLSPESCLIPFDPIPPSRQPCCQSLTSKLSDAMVWLPLSSMASTSKSCSPLSSEAAYSRGSLTEVAVLGSVTWKLPTITW